MTLPYGYLTNDLVISPWDRGIHNDPFLAVWTVWFVAADEDNILWIAIHLYIFMYSYTGLVSNKL